MLGGLLSIQLLGFLEVFLGVTMEKYHKLARIGNLFNLFPNHFQQNLSFYGVWFHHSWLKRTPYRSGSFDGSCQGCWVSHLPGIQSPAMPSLVLIERPQTGLGSGGRNLSGQPFMNGWFNGMIPNLYIEDGCFTKHPFTNGCLGFQVWLVVFGWIEKPFIRCFFFSGFSGAMRNLLQLLCFFGGRTENLCQVLTAEKQRRMAVVESFFESGWTENQENRTPTVRNSSSKFLSNPKSTQESWKSSLETGVICIMGMTASLQFFQPGAFYTL